MLRPQAATATQITSARALVDLARAGLAAPAAMLVVRIVMAHAALRRHFSGCTVPALLSGRSLATAHAISMGESGERSARRAQARHTQSTHLRRQLVQQLRP